jgi:hypothetical protein
MLQILECTDGTAHLILEQKMEAQQFSPTIFKYLMMTNVG